MTAFGCYKNTIRLISGHYLDLRNPQPDQFTLGDIAGALSKICRFGGQCSRFYSVAEHSFHCACQAIDDALQSPIVRACLMHDAAEAFIGDIVKPLKVMLPEYAAIEEKMEAVIAAKYGIDFEGTKAAWKKIDMEMLIAERKTLFSKDDVEWTGERLVRAIPLKPQCWEPERAEKEFLACAMCWQIED